MKIFELIPTNGRKSFYGKAKAIETDDGEKILLSYDTQVLKIDKDGKPVKLWNGKSNTTSTHIKAFCEFYGVDFWGVV